MVIAGRRRQECFVGSAQRPLGHSQEQQILIRFLQLGSFWRHPVREFKD